MDSTTNNATGLIQGNNTGVFLRGTASLNNAGDIVGGTISYSYELVDNSLLHSGSTDAALYSLAALIVVGSLVALRVTRAGALATAKVN